MTVWFMRGCIFCCLLVLTGCASSGTPINYYLVDPVVAQALRGQTDQALSIEILDVAIPQYLERFQLATRTGQGQMSYSDQHQWAESLRKNLTRTMTRSLGVALGTIDIASPFSRTLSTPDYRVQVFIEQLERGSDGRVQLVARWQVSTGKSSSPLSINAIELASDKPLQARDYPAMVIAISEVFGELCIAIAESILVEVDKS